MSGLALALVEQQPACAETLRRFPDGANATGTASYASTATTDATTVVRRRAAGYSARRTGAGVLSSIVTLT
jgi:hypothetical protein